MAVLWIGSLEKDFDPIEGCYDGLCLEDVERVRMNSDSVSRERTYDAACKTACDTGSDDVTKRLFVILDV